MRRVTLLLQMRMNGRRMSNNRYARTGLVDDHSTTQSGPGTHAKKAKERTEEKTQHANLCKHDDRAKPHSRAGFTAAGVANREDTH